MELYKIVADLTESAEKGNSYKNKLFSTKNKKKIKSIHLLCTNSVKKKKIIDDLLLKVGVTEITWLKRAILYEFLWGRRNKILNLQSNAVVGEIIKHRQDILKHLHHVEKENLIEDETELPRYIRINLEKMTKTECIELLKKKSFQLISCPASCEEFLRQIKVLKSNEYMCDYHIPNLLVFSHKAKLQNLPLTDFIRQDKSSCLVLPLLAPLPGSSILDMCAAPGYKTQHAASFISKLGRIYSVDINKERFSTLKNTIKLFNLDECCVPLNKDALKINEEICPKVEYIILDAPCSGTGMFNTLIKHTASEERLKKLHNIQVMLLKHALKNFSCVRRVCYSTCSVTEEENEQVVSECLDLAEEQGFHLVPLASVYKSSFQSGKGSYTCSPFVLRTSPDVHLTNGFFVALFERPVPPELPNWSLEISVGNKKNSKCAIKEQENEKRVEQPFDKLISSQTQKRFKKKRKIKIN